MRIRLTPEDDYLHPLEEASNFNESRYYNFFDPSCGLGGWVRMGNRPNEGYAEMTTCFYLPSGAVAFMFGRPKIEGHTAHDAGGLSFEVVEPYVEHRITYDGKVVAARQPARHGGPEGGVHRATRGSTARMDLARAAPSPGRGAASPRPRRARRSARSTRRSRFARGHTEQHMASTGTVTIGDETFEVDGALGLRDHSWGPRYWQAVWWYRWLTVNLGPDLGFATTIAGTEGGDRHVHGFLYDRKRYGDDQWVPIRDVELSSDYDDGWYHHAVHALVKTDDHEYPVEGDGVVEHPAAQPARGPGDPHHRGHDHVALRRPRGRRPRRVPRPDRRWPTRRHRRRHLSLARRAGGGRSAAAAIDGLERLSGGASRETWRFDAVRPTARRRADPAARPARVDPACPARWGSEAASIRAAGGGRPAVPEIVLATDDADLWGSAGIVMRRVEGETLARRILRDDEYAEAREVLAGAVRRVPRRAARPRPRAVPGLADDDPVELCRRNLRPRRRAERRPSTSPSAGSRSTARRRPGRAIVHGDFRLGNLIVGPDGLRAVLDWELVHEGDPVEDLGWLCVRCWRFGAPLPVGGLRHPRGAARAPTPPPAAPRSTPRCCGGGRCSTP